MPIVLLIRHGENEYVKTGKMAGCLPDVHLNEHGIQQAEELAKSLVNIPIKAIFSSPLERAQETAKPIADKLKLNIQIHQGLVETGIGDWTGQELSKLRKLPIWKTVQQTPSLFRFPNGESFLECQVRLVNALEIICKTVSDQDIITVVSHADPIKLVSAYYLGLPLDNFQRLACDTASVSSWIISKHGNQLVKLNQKAPFDSSFHQFRK